MWSPRHFVEGQEARAFHVGLKGAVTNGQLVAPWHQARVGSKEQDPLMEQTNKNHVKRLRDDMMMPKDRCPLKEGVDKQLSSKGDMPEI